MYLIITNNKRRYISLGNQKLNILHIKITTYVITERKIIKSLK